MKEAVTSTSLNLIRNYLHGANWYLILNIIYRDLDNISWWWQLEKNYHQKCKTAMSFQYIRVTHDYRYFCRTALEPPWETCLPGFLPPSSRPLPAGGGQLEKLLHATHYVTGISNFTCAKNRPMINVDGAILEEEVRKRFWNFSVK